jgi:two-component system, LytTR family, sensor kinase
MILQTAVENAIKHGISQLPKGGELNIDIHAKKSSICLVVANSGQLSQNGNHSPKTPRASGCANSKQRLKLMYGEEASLNLTEADGTVYTTMIIPKLKKHESNSGGR